MINFINMTKTEKLQLARDVIFDEIGESIDPKLNRSLEATKKHLTNKLLKLEKVVINQEEYYQWVNIGEPNSVGNLFKDWRDIPREKLKLI